MNPFDHAPPPRRVRGAAPSLLIALVALLVAAGGIAWWLARRASAPELVAPPAGAATDGRVQEPAITPPAEVAAPSATVTPDPEWDAAMQQAGTIRVRDKATGKVESQPIYTLDGKVIDDEDEGPVYYFKAWMIPTSMGDPLTARNTLSPSSGVKGRLHLTHQLAGDYHLVVESREHEPVTRLIQIPWEHGELEIRLRHGTAIRGVVRDNFLTPLPGVAVELVVDPARIDGGAPPPMMRRVNTDASGNYAFWKVPPGTYGLEIELGADVLAREPEFRIDAGGEFRRDFTLERFGSLRVLVSNPVDQPVAKANTVLWVTADDGRDRIVRSAQSDLQGRARLDFVKEGSYKLKVTSPGFEPHEETIVVAAGESVRELPVRLELRRASGG